MAAPKKWTEEQDNILRELYRNHTCKELEPILNHPYRAIETRAYKLGLCKDKQWKLERSRATTFKKGHVPHSKGKTWDQMFTPGQQERMRANTFKKGHTAHNKRPVGYEYKKREYWWVKVADPDVYMPKHRLLWEKHHGPIPEGVVITFIDGNPDNITIENLRAETKEEKFQRCCCPHNIFPPEIRKLIQLKGVLKRQINKLDRKNDKKNRIKRSRTPGLDEETSMGI